MDKNSPELEPPPLPPSSLFPITPASQQVSSVPQWLSNTSFTANSSLINNAAAAASHFNHDRSTTPPPPPPPKEEALPKPKPYELIESSSASSSGSEASDDREKKRKRRKKKKKSSSKRRYERSGGAFTGFGSRKPSVRVWAGSQLKPSENYYLDSKADLDNLAFGCLYRMDIARYKPFAAVSDSSGDFQAFYQGNQRGSGLEREADVDALDGKLKSGGRYWSAKYVALERHKNLKRLRLLAPRDNADTVAGDFIPLMAGGESDEGEGVDADVSTAGVVEESWEDELLRKTREFNRATRERPHDEKTWMDFAEFQDKVAEMQPQKGARLQTLEKKISILEKATELNPDNEELLLCLLKAYKRRDTSDVLISRWEKILIQHSGSYNLWREFLRVIQGEFSRFKVSDMRKMYSHAIQAISAACRMHYRQDQGDISHPDLATVKLELGLVDIFLSYCRFEWQVGYQELATALFQAEIEFSLFCPSLLLTEQSKQILFEHFWNSDGARVGEEGALGWSAWLEKEEQNRQKVFREEVENDSRGGWTGWSEPSSNNVESTDMEIDTESNALPEEFQEETENDDIKGEEDTEALLKMLGIDVDVGASGEVNDISTLIRWSEEEKTRDCDQWMPVRAKPEAGASDNDGEPDKEAEEHLSRVIMFEDVTEYLFSLSSFEARLSLVLQFVDFFGGKTSQWISTNSSAWSEKLLGVETFPQSVSLALRRVHDVLSKNQDGSCSFSLESLLGTTNYIHVKADMMKLIRNATLLCLSAFPRNHLLEEAALIAEEQSDVNPNPSRSSATPCRALAKYLLKSDRQDILLCGVYARREAFYGNIDHARRVFDMALSSIEGLPLELRSNAPLLYLWYAEVELAKDDGNQSESAFRAMHILSCLGSGGSYSPFKCQPSNLQLLRARQGFKERIKTVQSSWVRGVIDDQSAALICCAALLEEFTSGWASGIEVLDQAFAMVLPERKRHSHQLEFMFSFYTKMLWRHHGQSSLSNCWKSVLQGIQIYPASPELYSDLIEVGHFYTTSNKLRWVFDDYCRKKPSVIAWLFALSFEISRGSSQHRIRGLFERALANDRFHSSVVLWRCYIAYEMNVACNPNTSKRIFFRAIHACPWSKKLWLDGFLKLNSALSAKELSDLQEVMRDKELNLRTDIYEILLQDELAV